MIIGVLLIVFVGVMTWLWDPPMPPNGHCTP